MLKLTADMKNLPLFIEKIGGCVEKMNFEHSAVMQIELAFEEVIVNIINYAYPDVEDGSIEVSCIQKDGCMVIEITDSGIPFDITAAGDPDTDAPVEKRKIGGLGILFVKKMMDEVRYRRDGDKNIVTLIKKINS